MDKCIPGRGNPERVAGGSGRPLGEVGGRDLGGVWVADGKKAPGSEHRGLGVAPLSGQGVWVDGGGLCEVRWSDVEGTLASVRPLLRVPGAPQALPVPAQCILLLLQQPREVEGSVIVSISSGGEPGHWQPWALNPRRRFLSRILSGYALQNKLALGAGGCW